MDHDWWRGEALEGIGAKIMSRSHARDTCRLSELLGLAPAYFGYFVPTLAPRLLNPCPLSLVCPLPVQLLRWQHSVCVRRRSCVGIVIRTFKRAICCLRTHSEQAKFAGFSA